MRNKLFANWGIKLISLLAAFGLWFAVVYFEDPLIEETFTNIPVQFENTDLLTDQGLVYEVVDNTDVVKRVTVKGPKTVVSEMTKDSIVATADFSEKNMSDVIKIEFEAVNQYASAITEISTPEGSDELQLFVEEKISRSIPVTVNIIGEVAAEHQLGSAKTDQNRITVTGGKSKVDMVSYAAVSIDVTGSETDISTTEVIRLYDKDDNLLDTNLVQKNINSTKTNVTILATKTVPVEFEITGEVAEGYLLTGQVVCDKESVKIAGTDSALLGVNSVKIPADDLDVTGMTENLVAQVNLKNYLPSGVQIAKDGGTGVAEVKVFIEPEATLDLKVMADNIAILNVPEGLAATIEEPYTVYDLQVKGLNRDISRIVEAELRGTVDVQAWMSAQEMEELTPESYYIPALIMVPEGVDISIPVEVRVTLTIAEEVDELEE